MNTNKLPLPSFFDPRHAEDHRYSPDQQGIFSRAIEWKKAHGIKPSATDERNIHLLLIDVQKDFCFPEGSLYVAGRNGRGAMDDNRRVAQFILKT